MVRHEAAEALGALGDDAALDSLRRHKDSPIVEIAETCEVTTLAMPSVWQQHGQVAAP
jgi:deoxyhypusine monooxygenase